MYKTSIKPKLFLYQLGVKIIMDEEIILSNIADELVNLYVETRNICDRIEELGLQLKEIRNEKQQLE